MTAYTGGWVFGLFLLAVSFLAQLELYQMMRAGGVRPHRVAGLSAGALLLLAPLLPGAYAGALLLLTGYIALSAFTDVERQSLFAVACTLFGAVYPTALLGFLLHIRVTEGALQAETDAMLLTLYTLALVWSTDTLAYYTGRLVGSHPLAPSISPKKTWEGAAGGAVGAVITGLAIKGILLPFLDWGDAIAISLICSVAGQVGDLAESRFKRTVGVKDSGRLLPGHGGMLDRLDALTLAAPLVYLYLLLATPHL